METMKSGVKMVQSTGKRLALPVALAFMTLVVSSVGFALALCDTDLVATIGNAATTLVRIGPVLGLMSGILAMIMMSQVTAKDKKKKWKQRRNDAFIYGVLGVGLAGAIADVLLNFVLVGDGADTATECFTDLSFVT